MALVHRSGLKACLCAGTISFDAFQSFWRSDGRFKALQLSEEQEHFVVDVSALFRSVDGNMSGTIDTQEEWLALYDSLCSGGYVNANVISGEQLWTALDRDDEGTVCFTEYLSWMVRVEEQFSCVCVLVRWGSHAFEFAAENQWAPVSRQQRPRLFCVGETGITGCRRVYKVR